MAGGTLYFTARTRRDAIALDAATVETLWMYRLDEGPRGQVVARAVNRGLAYWSDGKRDERILLISPGFQLIALNAKTGIPIPALTKLSELRPQFRFDCRRHSRRLAKIPEHVGIALLRTCNGPFGVFPVAHPECSFGNLGEREAHVQVRPD